MAEVRDQDGDVIETYEPSVWRPALNRTDAQQLRTMMLGVATSGTATGLQVPGFEVGGKTGTAQVVADSDDTHAWIIGFAGPPGEPMIHAWVPSEVPSSAVPVLPPTRTPSMAS